MVYEIRGSLSVFLVLTITASFNSFYRTIALVLLSLWSIVFDRDVLLAIPFYLGAVLADLSLMIAKNTKTSTYPVLNSRLNSALSRLIKDHWPIILTIFSLFLAGYPPNSADRTAWSRSLYYYADSIIPAYDRISHALRVVLTRV
jgi:hypothetical protein